MDGWGFSTCGARSVRAAACAMALVAASCGVGAPTSGVTDLRPAVATCVRRLVAREGTVRMSATRREVLNALPATVFDDGNFNHSIPAQAAGLLDGGSPPAVVVFTLDADEKAVESISVYFPVEGADADALVAAARAACEDARVDVTRTAGRTHAFQATVQVPDPDPEGSAEAGIEPEESGEYVIDVDLVVEACDGLLAVRFQPSL